MIRTIIHKLEKLNMRQYHFECSKIFTNIMFRGSILRWQMQLKLTEMNLRRIERIDDNYMITSSARSATLEDTS